MSLRRMIFVLIALVASGSTIVIGRMWLEAQRAHQQVVEKPAEQPTGPNVLVAKGNLPAGTFIRPENLRWQLWPEANVAGSYIVQSKHRLEDYVGAVVRSGIGDGEPLTDTRVVRPGDRGFLAAVLTPGYRAVTVNVSPSSGLAGLVFPGDKVDLIGSFHIEFENKGDEHYLPHNASETVLSDVRVLAVDQRVDDQNKEVAVAKTATLEVTPKQAEIIAVVAETGKFSLSLRSLAPADGASEVVSDARTFTWDSDAVSMLSPPAGAGGGTKKVSVVRGDKAESLDFPRSQR